MSKKEFSQLAPQFYSVDDIHGVLPLDLPVVVHALVEILQLLRALGIQILQTANTQVKILHNSHPWTSSTEVEGISNHRTSSADLD